MRTLLVRASILVLAFLLGCPQSPGESGPNKVEACDTPGISTCAPEMDSRGARARFCAATQSGNYCLNVCNADNTDFAPGSQAAGAQCEYDVDCAAGSTCDNDRVGAATCKCIADPVCRPSYTVGVRQVFGDERFGAGERWHLARTCKRTDGTCVNPELTIGIAVNANDIAQTRWGGGGGPRRGLRRSLLWRRLRMGRGGRGRGGVRDRQVDVQHRGGVSRGGDDLRSPQRRRGREV